jgi:excisionase family DNA binding protein
VRAATQRPSAGVARAVGAGDEGERPATDRVARLRAVPKAPSAACVVVFDEDGREVARSTDATLIAATTLFARRTAANDPAPAEPASGWATVGELAASGVFSSEKAARNAIARGELRAARNGRQLLVRRDDLDAYLAARVVAARPGKAARTPSSTPPQTSAPADPMDARLRAAGLARRPA